MWKKAAALLGSWIVVLAVLVAHSSMLPSSALTWYQPEVPRGLRK